MINIEKFSSHTVVRIEDRLDTLTSADFERDMKPVTAEKDFIAVDLSKCPYLSSSGIRSLLQAARILNQRKGFLILFGISPGVFQVIEMAGLQNVFHIVEKEEDVIACLNDHLQSAPVSEVIEIDDKIYDISLNKKGSAEAEIWYRQGLAGYDELGLSFGLGRTDENFGVMGLFATTFNSSIFLPFDQSLPGDFRLTQHPDQTGMMVTEAVSFEHTAACRITTNHEKPILIEQLTNHLEKIIDLHFPENKLASFLLFNHDPAMPSVIAGLFIKGLDRELTLHPFEMVSCPFFNESLHSAACLEYRLAGLDSSVTVIDPVARLRETLTFENIIEVKRVEDSGFVTMPIVWLFTADRTGNAAAKRLQINGPEGFDQSPWKPFLTRRLYKDSSVVNVKALHGGYSAQTFQVESFDQQGRKLRPTVLKMGPRAMITREADRCQKYALPFIMNNSAMVLGTEFYGDMGALRYNFVGIEGEETSLKWLTHLFHEWPVNKLEPLFDKIFLKILKPWYGQSIKGSIHPFREHDPSLTFFSGIFEKAENFTGVSCDDSEMQFMKTGPRIFNPYWYLKHDYPQMRETALEYYTSICHGDLNMQNILLDQNLNVYLIDFSETMPRSAVSDFARLEAIFMIESLPVDKEKELNAVIQMITEIYHADELDESLHARYSGDNSDQVTRSIALSRKMRSYALNCTEGNNDIIPYCFALLEWILPVVCFAGPANQKWLSVMAASILMEKIFRRFGMRPF